MVNFDKLTDEHTVTGDSLDCGHLIVTHEPAVPFHIRAQDSSKFSNDLIPVLRHAVKPSILVLPKRICKVRIAVRKVYICLFERRQPDNHQFCNASILFVENAYGPSE